MLKVSKIYFGASPVFTVYVKGVENRTYLEVRDNGVGGAQLDTSRLGRLGLVGVKERVEQLHGELEIISSENGTCAKVIL